MKVRAIVVCSFLALACLGAGAAERIVLRTASIEIRYDDHFQRHVRWLKDRGRNIVDYDPAAQDGIVAAGGPVTEFQLPAEGVAQRQVTDPEFGPALEAILTGSYRGEDKEIQLVRRTRVLLPERFPDVAIFQTSYENRSQRPLQIKKVYSQRLVLDRRLTDQREDSWAFASFQGGAYKWGRDYALILLKPGFRQSNFQGLDNRNGPEGEGGGMPFVDIWAPGMGVAIAQIEKKPQWVSLPVEVRADQKTEIAVTEEPSERLKQQEWLKPGETYQAVTTAVIFHHGDYFDALSTYADLLRARGIAIPRTSPDFAYEPYWKSWGFEFDFTLDKIYGQLPELKKLGIRIANLDDGWFDWYGDWQPLQKPGKFPRGDADMKEYVRHMHGEGFKTAVWWYPLGVSPQSKLRAEHPELLVQDANGNYPVDDRGVHQFCPAYEPARRYIAALVKRFVGDYDFDGVYVDSVGLTAVPPCFNSAHHHASPVESFQSIPLMFETIQTTLHQLKPDGWEDVCICAMPHSLYNMPYYPLGSASDPVNVLQVRRRVKLEKAIRGPSAAVGDCYQVPMHQWRGASVPEDFETTMGTGAVMQTFFDNLNNDEKLRFERWFTTYRNMNLARGEYLNLYDIAWDKPEGHAVRKGDEMYYGFYADVWRSDRDIELRGLDRAKTYEVFDYANGRLLGNVSGAKPRLRAPFKGSLLLRVKPQ